MLSDLSYWMQARGFASDGAITEVIRAASRIERREMRTELNQILRAEQDRANGIPNMSSFNFLASSSFRGERCCSHPNCRMKKAPQLFEFAALYADQLFLPFDPGHDGDRGLLLEGCLRMAYHTSSLIDAGIVKPSVGSLHLCEECRAKLMGAETQLGEKVKKLQREHVHEFTVKVRMTVKRKKKSFAWNGEWASRVS
jgi:hypothetical protein